MVALARIVVAAVLVVAASAKLADRDASRQSVAAFGVPTTVAGVIGWTLIGAELGIAAALMFTPWHAWAAVGALVLLVIVSAAMAANLIRGRAPACHCFGRLSQGPIGWSALARNGVLAAIAGYVAAGGREAALFLLLAFVGGAAWFALSAGRRRGPAGASAPEFSLDAATGGNWTLAQLLGPGRPVLLVFSQPGCGACEALLDDLGEWHLRLGDRLTIVVVSLGSASGAGDGSVDRGGYLALVDPGSATASAYGVAATPSAALIESGARMAAPVAQGGEGIGELVSQRFGVADESPGIGRRAAIARAFGGATALGAFPLLAAACGSSQSSSTASKTTGAAAGRPKSLRVGGAYICRQRYALCTNAACRPSPHDPDTVICDCVVKSGYSIGLRPCSDRAPHGSSLTSTFSTELVTNGVRAMTCPADVPWANCVDSPCRLDHNDSSKATCQCPVVKTGPSFTFGGDCDTHTCGKTVWSGAHTTLGGPAVAAAMKRVGQPLATPKACPKS